MVNLPNQSVAALPPFPNFLYYAPNLRFIGEGNGRRGGNRRRRRGRLWPGDSRFRNGYRAGFGGRLGRLVPRSSSRKGVRDRFLGRFRKTSGTALVLEHGPAAHVADVPHVSGELGGLGLVEFRRPWGRWGGVTIGGLSLTTTSFNFLVKAFRFGSLRSSLPIRSRMSLASVRASGDFGYHTFPSVPPIRLTSSAGFRIPSGPI